jgi:hypothetical protein
MKNYLAKETNKRKLSTKRKKKRKKKRQNFLGCWRACFSKLQAPPYKRGGRKELSTNAR